METSDLTPSSSIGRYFSLTLTHNTHSFFYYLRLFLSLSLPFSSLSLSQGGCRLFDWGYADLIAAQKEFALSPSLSPLTTSSHSPSPDPLSLRTSSKLGMQQRDCRDLGFVRFKSFVNLCVLMACLSAYFGNDLRIADIGRGERRDSIRYP